MRVRRRYSSWLIADLDGTFLGGPPADQQRLNAFFRADRRDIGLVYCTGRSFADVAPLMDDGKLPVPSAIIGDVGTGLWDPHGRALSPGFDELVASRWANAQDRVLASVSAFDGLELQTGTGPHRCSFLYTEQQIAESAARCIRGLQLDALVSGGRYLDALPKGINKGFAVDHLMGLWGLDPQRVLVAGDTMNDLSMIALSAAPGGPHALAVGNADAELRAHLPVEGRAVLSEAHGAAAILERLQQLGWVD